jgi:hypothetical protein
MNILKNHCGAAGEYSKQFCQKLVVAIAQLRTRLRDKYAHLFPDRDDSLARALAEAEELAWQTPFPHLFLPGLAEVKVGEIANVPAYAQAA